MFWLEKRAAAAAQEEKAQEQGSQGKASLCCPCPAAFLLFMDFQSQRLQLDIWGLILPPRICLIFFGIIYTLTSPEAMLLWQCLLQATVWLCFHKKVFLEFNCCQLISVCSLISASLRLPVPHFTDLHHSPSKSPGQTLSTEKMIQIRLSLLSLFLQTVRSSGQWDVRAAQGRQGTDTPRGYREAQSLCYFVYNNL